MQRYISQDSDPARLLPKAGRERDSQRKLEQDAGRNAERGLSLPYLPGLDGLRALALLAVLLYHADVAWAPGGFLGVEVFFALSGYLITALLLADWRATGRIGLAAFWL